MRVRLKGVKRVTARGKTYYYAWSGGPRLTGEPGTPEFIESYNKAHSDQKKKRHLDTVGGLIAHYKSSDEYSSLRPRTKKDYGPIFRIIEDKFDTFPTKAFPDQRTRGLFKRFRSEFADTPRKADRIWSVMKRVFNVAKDDGLIVNNPCDGGGRLYSGSRAAIIWTPDQLAKAKAQAPLHIRDALVLAAETGQRQADLLELLWSQVDTDHLRITQNKNRKPVSIRLSRELRALLQDIKQRQTTNNHHSTHVLTNSRGLPWTQDGFQTSWRKAMKNLKIEGVTFHDLRGTAITRWAADGATVPQIAALSGHSMRDVEKILEAHYLADHQRLGDAVILRIDGEQK